MLPFNTFSLDGPTMVRLTEAWPYSSDFWSLPPAVGVNASLSLNFANLANNTPKLDAAIQEPVNLSSFFVPNDQNFGSQWHLVDSPFNGDDFDINVTSVWDDYSGADVRVGVVDDGVQYDHPDLVVNYDANGQWDYGGNDNNPYPDVSDYHGTAVAGLIVADANGIGVVGSAFGATVTGFRIFGGAVTESEFADVFFRQAELDVTNNSWGYGGYFYDDLDSSRFDAVAVAIDNAVINGRDGLGTVLLWAAGNSRLEGQNANYHGFQNARESIAVAAADDNGEISYYSTPGAPILVSAPSNGGNRGIVTTDRTGDAGYASGDYTYSFGGTSAATPITAGVVALMLEANPDLGYRDVQEILAYSARQIDSTDPSWSYNGAINWNGGGLHTSHDFGFGLIDAHAAVRLAESWEIQSTRSNEAALQVGSSPGQTILDGGVISDSVFVGGGLEIDHVEVELALSHTYIGDLTVTLTSPDGTSSVLVDRPGKTNPLSYGTGQDNIFFTLSSTNHWGETGAGEWVLDIADGAAGDVGVLHNWTLGLYGDAPSADDFYIFTDEYADFGGDPTRSVLSDSGGVDTINAAAVTSDTFIDLTGANVSAIAGTGLTIQSGTVIENYYGGDDDDTVLGNSAANALSGARGGDTLLGGAGDDYLSGGDGDDTLDGGFDDDAIFGGAGDDQLFGGDGQDQLEGGAANDFLSGGAQNDTLIGGDGSDRLDGDDGDDVLSGGDGADTLVGLDGDDVLIGGDGADLFYFGDFYGLDRIQDFNPDSGDLVDLTYQSSITSFEQLLTAATDDGVNTTITVNPGDQLTLEGVRKAELGASDFVIPSPSDTSSGFYSGAGVMITGFSFGGVIGFENPSPPKVDALLEPNALSSFGVQDEYILGGAGADSLNGGDGSDWIAGGGGNDDLTFDAGWGLDIVDFGGNGFGEADSALFSSTFYENMIIYRTGSHFAAFDISNSDALLMPDFNPAASGDLGSVTFQSKTAGSITITPNSDINGDFVPDFQQFSQPVFGTSAGDSLTSQGNSVFVWGGLGEDTLNGSTIGGDFLFGGGGDDTLRTNSSNLETDGNFLVGGSGNDQYFVEFGDVASIFDNSASGADSLIIAGYGFARPDSVSFTIDGDHLGLIDFATETVVFLWNWQSTDGKIEAVTMPSDGITYSHAQLTNNVFSSANFLGDFTWNELGIPESEINLTFELLTTMGGDDEGPLFNTPIGGTDFNETLEGFTGDNLIIGDGGDDTLIGRGGDDIYVLRPGDGNDSIDNISGASIGETNVLRFGPSVSAQDIQLTVDLSSPNDLHIQYSNNDSALLKDWFSANATIARQVIVETVDGGVMNVLSGPNGGDGADFLIGGLSDATVDGGDGNDHIFHQDSSPTPTALLRGGEGDDVLHGGAVQDGGVGDDILIGDAASQRFEFSPGGGHDTVREFAAGAGGDDVLDISTFDGVFTLNDVLALATDDGVNTLISLSPTDSILLEGVRASQLDAGDFAFAIPPPTFTIGDVVVNEGGIATFEIQRTGDVSDFSVVTFTTYIPGVATPASNADFNAQSTSLLFAAEETSRLVQVSTIDDALNENDETFALALHSPVGATIGDNLGLATIIDNDGILGTNGVDSLVGTANGEQLHGLAGADTLSGLAGADTLNGGAGDDLLIGGTEGDVYIRQANEGADTITDSSGTDTLRVTNVADKLSILNGNTRSGDDLSIDLGTGSVRILDHFNGGTVESLTLDFSGGGSETFTLATGLIGGDASGVITGGDVGEVLDGGGGDDVLFGNGGDDTLIGGAGDDLLLGGGGDDLFKLAPGSGADVIVGFDAGAGGPDRLDVSEFSALTDLQEILLIASDDGVDTTLNLSPSDSVVLAGVRTAQLDASDFVFSIPPPSFSVGDISVNEGDVASFTISRSGDLSESSMVSFLTYIPNVANPAVTDDFNYQNTTYFFAPGETSRTVDISTLQDSREEGDEVFALALHSPVGGTISDDIGLATIVDDDTAAPPPSFSVGDITINEGDIGTFTINRSGDVSGQSIVTFVTYIPNVVNPALTSDFNFQSTALLFDAGETSRAIDISTIDDNLVEGNEVFALALHSAIGATITDDIGLATITDNDVLSLPGLSVNDIAIDEDIGSATFTITRSGDVSSTSSVNYLTYIPNVTNPALTDDFNFDSDVLTFGAGETTQSVSVAINDDSIDESDEVFQLFLHSASGATILDNVGVATIIDNDPAPSSFVTDAFIFTGTDGNDVIVGSPGSDVLTGGNGDDTLTGGDGDDRFNFSNGDGSDVITDFSAGAKSDDVIDFSANTHFNTFDDIIENGVNSNDDVVIQSSGDTITLIGVKLIDLHDDDFLF